MAAKDNSPIAARLEPLAAFAVLVCYFGLAETGGSESSASSGGAAVTSKLAAG